MGLTNSLTTEEICPMRCCVKCENYRKDSIEYKRKYEIAKSGLTQEERDILIKLLINEQVKHMIPNNEYESDRYKHLEELKVKIKDM